MLRRSVPMPTNENCYSYNDATRRGTKTISASKPAAVAAAAAAVAVVVAVVVRAGVGVGGDGVSCLPLPLARLKSYGERETLR